jgi:hypothetical protein
MIMGRFNAVFGTAQGVLKVTPVIDLGAIDSRDSLAVASHSDQSPEEVGFGT